MARVIGSRGPRQKVMALHVAGFTQRSGIMEGDDQSLINLLFETADQKALGCWIMGGRVWELEIRGEVARRGTLCAPAVCTREEVETTVVSHAVARGVLTQSGPTTAWELLHWMHLRLHFAIIGTGNCGTTSLHLNLAQHPDIQFTTLEEDSFFAPGGSVKLWPVYKGKRVLPLHADVTEFNANWVDGPRVLGLNNPDIYDWEVGLQGLARVPNVRAVMVLCDPVSRFEKIFFYTNCDAKQNPDGSACRKKVSEASGNFLRSTLVGPRLAKVRGIFGERLLLVHQSALRDAPRATYDEVAEFVGAGPFPASTQFHRWNAHRGRRTDLCSNATLLAALKRRLAPEYRALAAAFAAAGARVPQELRARRTRCDRPDDLRESAESCFGQTRCSF